MIHEQEKQNKTAWAGIVLFNADGTPPPRRVYRLNLVQVRSRLLVITTLARLHGCGASDFVARPAYPDLDPIPRLGLCQPCTLNAIGPSRVTLSLFVGAR